MPCSPRDQIGVRYQRGDIGGQHSDGSGLATAATNDADEFLTAHAGLTVSAGQLLEDFAFLWREGFATEGSEQDAPWLPRLAGQRLPEQLVVG